MSIDLLTENQTLSLLRCFFVQSKALKDGLNPHDFCVLRQSEPEFTNYTGNYTGCLDYLFYTDTILRVRQILEPVDSKQLFRVCSSLVPLRHASCLSESSSVGALVIYLAAHKPFIFLRYWEGRRRMMVVVVRRSDDDWDHSGHSVFFLSRSLPRVFSSTSPVVIENIPFVSVYVRMYVHGLSRMYMWCHAVQGVGRTHKWERSSIL